MNSKDKRLIIDVLTFKKDKAYGYNQYLYNLLDYMYDNRFLINSKEIIIICENSQQKEFFKYKDRFTIKSFKFTNIIKRSLIQLFWNLSFKINNNDVVLYTSNYSTLFKRGKEILVIHDLLYKYNSYIKTSLMTIQRNILVPLSIKKSNIIIAISKFTRDEIVRFFKPNSLIKVIYNAFNFKKFEKFKDNKIKKEDIIISVCSSAKHKNTKLVIEAYKNYIEKGGTFDFFLIGSLKRDSEAYYSYYNLPNKIKNKIKIFSNITDKELYILYQKSKIYVSASKYEGLGMPIVEAMYYNLILVLPENPMIFKEISNNNAIYFDSSSYVSLTNAFFLAEKSNVPIYLLDSFKDHNTSLEYINLINTI